MKNGRFPHLPPDREPGPQSLRTRERRRILAPFVSIVGTAMYAAGIWLAAGGRGPLYHGAEELWGGLFFAACGLLVLSVPWFAWRGERLGRHPHLNGVVLEVGGGAFRRGDEVTVTGTRLPGEVEGIEVGVGCDERFDTELRVSQKFGSMTVRETGVAAVHEEYRPLGSASGGQSFRLRLPVDAPYSYEGDCVSYAWRVSARAPKRGRKDARHDSPIWVEP